MTQALATVETQSTQIPQWQQNSELLELRAKQNATRQELSQIETELTGLGRKLEQLQIKIREKKSAGYQQFSSRSDFEKSLRELNEKESDLLFSIDKKRSQFDRIRKDFEENQNRIEEVEQAAKQTQIQVSLGAMLESYETSREALETVQNHLLKIEGLVHSLASLGLKHFSLHPIAKAENHVRDLIYGVTEKLQLIRNFKNSGLGG